MHSGTKNLKQNFQFGSSTGTGGASLKLQRGRWMLMFSNKSKAGLLTWNQVRTNLDNRQKPQTQGIQNLCYQEEVNNAAGY